MLVVQAYDHHIAEKGAPLMSLSMVWVWACNLMRQMHLQALPHHALA